MWWKPLATHMISGHEEMQWVPPTEMRTQCMQCDQMGQPWGNLYSFLGDKPKCMLLGCWQIKVGGKNEGKNPDAVSSLFLSLLDV